jgi:hypothetical protein
MKPIMLAPDVTGCIERTATGHELVFRLPLQGNQRYHVLRVPVEPLRFLPFLLGLRQAYLLAFHCSKGIEDEAGDLRGENA